MRSKAIFNPYIGLLITLKKLGKGEVLLAMPAFYVDMFPCIVGVGLQGERKQLYYPYDSID